MKTKINVIIADDHPLWRKAIEDILLEHEEFTVTNGVSNVIELLISLQKSIPDLIILDVRMPSMDGYEALKEIKNLYPNIHVIILSDYCDEEPIVIDFIERGASFVLSKKVTEEDLVSSITSVIADEPHFEKDILKRLIHRDIKNSKAVKLTDQERAILLQFTKQKSIKEVAEFFFLSIATIKWHKANIYRKTKSLNEAGLTTYAFKRGWIH